MTDRNERATPIGERLQFQLTQLGKNASWLATKVGVARSTITRVLNGDRHPTPETLQEIAEVLGVALPQLVAGTDAADRVAEAQNLVSRADYQSAVRQVIAFEQKASDLSIRLIEAREDAARAAELCRAERNKREDAERSARSLEAERDRAVRDAELHAQDAQRYRDALEKAVSDVALLQTQLRELGSAVEGNKVTSRVAAILAGVAAAVSVANYLGAEAREAPTEPDATRSRTKPRAPAEPEQQRGGSR